MNPEREIVGGKEGHAERNGQTFRRIDDGKEIVELYVSTQTAHAVRSEEGVHDFSNKLQNHFAVIIVDFQSNLIGGRNAAVRGDGNIVFLLSLHVFGEEQRSGVIDGVRSNGTFPINSAPRYRFQIVDVHHTRSGGGE